MPAKPSRAWPAPTGIIKTLAFQSQATIVGVIYCELPYLKRYSCANSLVELRCST